MFNVVPLTVMGKKKSNSVMTQHFVTSERTNPTEQRVSFVASAREPSPSYQGQILLSGHCLQTATHSIRNCPIY